MTGAERCSEAGRRCAGRFAGTAEVLYGKGLYGKGLYGKGPYRNPSGSAP